MNLAQLVGNLDFKVVTAGEGINIKRNYFIIWNNFIDIHPLPVLGIPLIQRTILVMIINTFSLKEEHGDA